MHVPLSLSERVCRLRDQALHWEEHQKEYIGQRLYGAVSGLISADGLPWMHRRARMLCGVIEHAQPLIQMDERLAGYHYYGSEAGWVMEWQLNPLGIDEKAALYQYLTMGSLSEDKISFIMTALDRMADVRPPGSYYSDMPREVAEANDEGVIWAWGCPTNHTVIGYEKVLRLGFTSIRDEIGSRLEKLDWGDSEAPRKRMQYEALYELADAACTIGSHYHEKALKMLGSCVDSESRENLSHILSTTGRVPALPAETFREAVQSLWFAHILNCWEDGINANSLGRLDQILHPYYAADLQAGRLTREEAFELLCELWIKLYRDYDVQQVVLGGVDSEGRDAVNDLTWLMLDVTEALGFVRCLSVRLHPDSPQSLIRHSLELLAQGNGIPFFFNDSALIPALTANGIELKDARDYAAIGCVEITIPGKANPHAVSNRINLLKCLELALNNGVSMTTGHRVGSQTGEAAVFSDMEQLLSAYKEQTEHFIKLACYESNRLELHHSLMEPMPYKSLLTEGCLDSGLDFNAGGALYNFHESMAMGIPNVADALAAIEHLVFIQKKYTLRQVVDMLKQNYPNEGIRQEFLNRAPKYGNDIDAVDKYAAHILNHFCSVLQGIKGSIKGGFFAQPFTFLWMMEAGEKTAATPDGRRRGENLAYSVSPMQGRDYKGLTALINSLAKLPHDKAAGSTSAILEVDPSLFNQENLDTMTMLVQRAVQLGVGQLQFNVVSAETLKNAQKTPEQYRNLSVRVSGFSQQFCLLDSKLQDHIIARTKHTSG